MEHLILSSRTATSATYNRFLSMKSICLTATTFCYSEISSTDHRRPPSGLTLPFLAALSKSSLYQTGSRCGHALSMRLPQYTTTGSTFGSTSSRRIHGSTPTVAPPSGPTGRLECDYSAFVYNQLRYRIRIDHCTLRHG